MNQAMVEPGVRVIGRINWLGVRTLYAKEVLRFLRVFMQTVAAPVTTTLIFLAIFSLALGGAGRGVGEVPFLEFLAPGLIMMAIAQNAFANTSSSLLVSKVQGNIVDVLMPPLSPGELVFAYVAGGATRGLVVGAAVALAMAFFVPLGLHSLAAVLYFSVAASLLLSLLGLYAGIWAEKFDHMSVVTNFVITPLSFLSGTFYSVERLPGVWHDLSQLNPFFYMIDGFRYGVIGHADGSVAIGFVVLAMLDVALLVGAYALFRTGYKLKS